MDRELKNKLLRYSILALIFFVTALGFEYFSGKVDRTDSAIRKKTESVLREKEIYLEGIIDRLVLPGMQNVLFSNFDEIVPRDLWEKDRMTIFVYQDDSLIYWSDNNVPAFPGDLAESLEEPFILHGNGWFEVKKRRSENQFVIGLILVMNHYPYQNEYLKNDYQEDLGIDINTRLDTIPGRINIEDNKGTFLFSLDNSGIRHKFNEYSTLTFFLFIAALIFVLIFLFYLYHLFDFFRKRPLLLFLAFLFDALFLRVLLLWLKVPGFLYHTELFSPYFFATSFISPSLGDLVVNSFVWLTLAWLFYKKVNLEMNRLSPLMKHLIGMLMILISAGFFMLLMFTVKRMILDSSFEISLNNIFNIKIHSFLAFLAIIVQFVAFFLASSKLSCTLCNSGIRGKEYIMIIILVSALLVPFFCTHAATLLGIVFPALFLFFQLSFLFFLNKKSGYHSLSGVLFYIVLFSLIGTFLLDFYLDAREKDRRKILATELSTKRDPMMEYEFGRMIETISKDTTLRALLTVKDTAGNWDWNVSEYLRKKYFKDIWEDYEQQITVCDEQQVLEIRPDGYLVNCFDYFSGILEGNMADTVADGLFFLKNRSENNNYLAVFKLSRPSGNELVARIYVELFYKYVKETGLGYPDLLIDKKVKMVSGLANYSYSRYFDRSLIYKYGDFSYRLTFEPYFHFDSNAYFIDKEGYNHYVIASDIDNILIISKKNPNWLDLIAPFSYLFIFFSLFILLFLIVLMLPGRFRNLEFSFSNQLQLSIILIIVISFFILGVVTRSRIIHLNNEKNRDILSEKTFSVLTELEHKIGDVPTISPDLEGYLQELLYKFTVIFYSDINLYDPHGNLIASSRPQIFEEGLLSRKMNTAAFQKVAIEMNLLWIQNEHIGLQEYLSSYIPFRNNNDEIIAYINLPYFAKQTEIRKEISDFLVAYINVYVLLIVLAIMVTIIVSRLVTRPLQLIREKLGRVALGKANEKIEWERKDEIGSLVEEYNRMVDELARSAEMLASSERESAWREMAKQVAHEIKNPLTPMKLSIQYLKKAWDEKAPDWENRLERFTRTIIEQIESLSQIASAFSDFAKMPVAHPEKIELTSVVRDAVDLYQDIDNIQFATEFQPRQHFVRADNRQLLRVFNNLIQNAVQAIGEKEGGKIDIRIAYNSGFHEIEISDNGAGISEEQAGRIFSPSFTTKTSGMGLGLAMVKSIVTSIGGSVSFRSTEGSGTTFLLKIPEYSEI